MSLSRRRHAKSGIVRCAVKSTVEALEKRTLFTSLINGVFSGTQTAFDGTPVFEYRQANGNAAIRISVTGNITAEFIGARAASGVELISHPSGVIISDQPDPVTGLTTQLVPVTVAASDIFLFSIYIVHADMNSAISIAQVPNTNVAARPMQPFTGGTAIRFTDATTGLSTIITPPDGGVYIGAETANNLASPSNSIPLLEGDDPDAIDPPVPPVTSFGLRPSSAGRIFAGIQTAPKVSIGKIFIGGTVTGKVSVTGQMDEFYAGNVLTGDAPPGITSTTVPAVELQDNFHIGGSIHNLITANSFGTITLATNSGTDPSAITYKTGFQLSVGGRVGQIFSANSFLGSALVNDDPTLKEPGGPQHEVEVRGANQTGSVSYFDPTDFGYNISLGDTANDARFFNDTFATAQFLGTSRSTQIGARDSIQLQGNLGDFGSNGTLDAVDYYAVTLLAGQSMDVKLTDLLTQIPVNEQVHLGIFDPDGRLIATDYSNLSATARLGKTIRIVADRPGAYRIAVAGYGDFNYNGLVDAATATTPAEPPVTILLPSPYELDITRTGDISVGGIVARVDVATTDTDSRGIEVVRGDLGEILAGTGAANLIFSFSDPWIVRNGNLRAMEAVNMGINLAAAGGAAATYVVDSGPDFQVLRGSVGLLRTTGATPSSALIINDGVFTLTGDAVVYPVASDDLSLTPGFLAVGKDIQLVDSAGAFEGDLLAKGSIGVIRALSVGGVISPNGLGGGGGNSSPVIQVNVDGKGPAGVIDLIDATGSTTVGALNFPAITTGPNGNVRYVHIPTGQQAFPDQFFGGLLGDDTLYSPGEKVNLTDDSGTNVTLTPTPLDLNPALPIPATATSDFLDPPELDVVTLPIRDKAGVVIVRVTVIPVDDTTDGVVRTGGGGLTVQSGANGPNGGVEIGEVVRGTITGVTAAGAPSANTITFDPFNRVYTPTALAGAATDPRDVNFIFRGGSPVDVWNINDTFAADTITSVNNQTSGEIANFVPLGATGTLGANFPDVVNLQGNTLGLAMTHTGTAVEGRIILDNTLPYANQRNLVRLADVETVRARSGLGNFLVNNAGTVIANSDGADNKNAFEGIDAPFVVRTPGASNLTGNLVSLNIGEGVLPSGTGAFARSGVFVDGIIDSIVGKNADIRGTIDAAGTTVFATQQATDPATGAGLTNPDGTPLIVSTPTFDIGKIQIQNGSIIDAAVMTVPVAQTPVTFFASRTVTVTAGSSFANPRFQIGAVNLSGNGGIIGALIETANMGAINIQGGFGLLSSAIVCTGASVVKSIATDGFGVRDTSIRSSSLKSIVARGNGNATSVAKYNPRVRYSEKTSIDPYSGEELDEFNDLDKFLGTTKAKPVVKGVTNTGWIEDDVITGTRDLGNIEAEKIFARDTTQTDPLTGKVSKVAPGSALYPMRISYGSSTATILVHDMIDGFALTTGSLKSLFVTNGMFNSTLSVAGRVKSITAGSIRSNSSIKVTGGDGTLESLKTRGDMAASVNVSQSILSMQVGGNLGSKLVHTGQDLNLLSVQGSILTGVVVDVADTLNNLFVGGDIKAGAVVKAHRINKQTIKGQISGDIIIT